MTEEIKYYKEKEYPLKWIPAEEMEETPQQTITRLEQENKDFEVLAKSLYKRIEELEKENEALAFRERLYKADYEASEQENKNLKKQIESDKGLITVGGKQQYQYLQRIDELEQENKEEKKAYNECMHYLACMTEQRNKLKTALEEILESAKFAQCLPCGSGNLEDCLNCDDEITNNGQFCMEKRIHEIKTKCVEVLTP